METPDNTKIWTPSWKFLIITVLLGANIVLIRIIEALVNNRELSTIMREICMNSSGVYQRLDNHNAAKQNNAELRQVLCVNDPDNSSGCLLCPYGWFLHGDDCYYYSDVRGRTWNQSRDQCKMMGADLLVIKNQGQQEIIQRNLRQRVEDIYWIGLHRDGDGWRWVDGGEHYNSSLIQIKSQSPGRCVSMTRSGYYQDDCSSTYRWICVKRAVRI